MKNFRLLLISPSAIQKLELGNEFITFDARFSGTPMQVVVPTAAVLGIYAKESGHGMLFPEEGDMEAESEPQPPDRPTGPSLKVVK